MGRLHTRIQSACAGLAAFVWATTVLGVPSDALERAREAIGQGNFKAALIDLKALPREDQEYAQTQLLLGKVYLHFGDGKQAEAALRKAQALGADPSLWRTELAHALVLQSRHEEALDTLDPGHEGGAEEGAQMLVVKGLAELGLGNTSRAEQLFRAALGKAPGNTDAGVGLIRVAIANRDLDATLKAADDVLIHSPENLDALMIRAEHARRQGETSKAAGLFEQVIARDPENPRALLGHAMVMVDALSFDRASADLDRLDGIQPNLPMSNYLRGLIAFRNKEPDRAVQLIGQALSAIPESEQRTLLDGVAATAQGKPRVAEDYLGRLVQALPGNVAARMYLAEIRIRLGEPDRAIEVLKSASDGNADARLMALLVEDLDSENSR